MGRRSLLGGLRHENSLLDVDAQGERRESGGAAIDFTAVPDLDHFNGAACVIDGMSDSAVAALATHVFRGRVDLGHFDATVPC